MNANPFRFQTNILRTTFALRVEALQETDQFIEKAIKTEVDRKERELEERLEESQDEAEQEAIREYSSDDLYLLSEQLPKNYRYSMVVSIYSLLEQTMVRLCRMIKRHNPGIPEPNFRAGIIFNAKQYLTVHGGIRFRKASRNWTRIIKYNKIRNLIVHHEGLIPKNEIDEYKRILRSLKFVRIDFHRRIEIERKFVPRMLGTIVGFVMSEMFRAGSKPWSVTQNWRQDI